MRNRGLILAVAALSGVTAALATYQGLKDVPEEKVRRRLLMSMVMTLMQALRIGGVIPRFGLRRPGEHD